MKKLIAIISIIVASITIASETSYVTYIDTDGKPVTIAFPGGKIKNVKVAIVNNNITNEVPYTVTVVTNTISKVSTK